MIYHAWYDTAECFACGPRLADSYDTYAEAEERVANLNADGYDAWVEEEDEEEIS